MPPNHGKVKPDVIDTFIIIFAAFTIDLVLLWMAAGICHIKLFDTLPSWLSSIGTFLSTTASTVVLSALKYLLNDKRQKRPNYFSLIVCSAFVILILVGGIARFLPPPIPPINVKAYEEFKLCIDLRYNDSPKKIDQAYCYKMIKYIQKAPIPLPPRNIREDKGLYHTLIDVPLTPPQTHIASFRYTPNIGNLPGISPNDYITGICLSRKEFDNKESEKLIKLDCNAGGECSTDPNDLGWVDSCTAMIEQPNTDYSFIKLDKAYAQSPEDKKKSPPGWIVPSLETLQEMNDRKGVGYTEFCIETDPISDLEEVDSLVLGVKTNGTPVYFDGWPPEYIPIRITPKKGIKILFALENLSFSGIEKGKDKIEASLTYRSKNKLIRNVLLSMEYVALRSSPMITVIGNDGVEYRWSGRYIPAKNENKFEIFFHSTQNGLEAVNLKQELDKAQLIYDNKKVVGVIRPPLEKKKNLSFGIVVGLLQPTGQVQFTYDEQTANSLCKWVLEIRKTKEITIIEPDSYRYEVDLEQWCPCRDIDI